MFGNTAQFHPLTRLTRYLLTLITLLLPAGLLFIPTGALAENQKIFSFKINAEDLQKYHDFLQGRDPLTIKDTKSDYLWRHPLELFLFQIAPVIGGCNCRIEYQPFDLITTHVRALVDVKNGLKLSHPIAKFVEDTQFADQYYLSDPILAADEFFVGLYTHKDRTKILELRDIEEIKKLRFVSAATWPIDTQLIINLGLPLVIADHWKSLLAMLKAARADVVMQPFSPKEDFSFDYGEPSETFLPIPGVRLLFNHGRQYFVSRKHPDGEFFIKHLNQGIRELRESGFLSEANINAGLVNPRTQDWHIIK